MKPMIIKSRNYALLAGALLCVAGIVTAQAQSSIVTFSVDMATNIALGTFTPGTDTVSANGTFNGYGPLNLVQQGSSTVYTNTANDTIDANGGKLQYKFVLDGSTWENTGSGNDRAALLPATSGASLVLPTAFFNDAGAPVTNDVSFQVDVSQQINLGNFTLGTSYVEIRGEFNGWTGGVDLLTNDTSILRTNQYGLVTSNVWVGTFPVVGSPGAAEAFKYVLQPGTFWDSPSGVNANGGGNRYFANVAQTLPIVFFNDAPYAPIGQLTFSVDMSIVALTDTNYNSASVVVWGDFNGWGGGVAMTNNPSALNTNIYTSPLISVGEGSAVNYQFRYLTLSTGDTVYDHLNGANGGGGNRYYQMPIVALTNLPPVIFNDASLSDYLLVPTPVLFSVDMNGAVGTDAHAFNPALDTVYINGAFPNWYAWATGINPVPAPAGYQMVEQGLTTIYTNTIIMPAGTPVSFAYKYGMDANSFYGGPADDEAGFAQNHYRVVRNTAFNPYVMPTDTFGYQYNEPFFNSLNTAGGHLTVGAQSGGNVPVSWLGRPGARLQTTTDLTSGVWQTIVATDGTNWTAGYSSTNGFVSVTNWPASGNTFFRLIKQ